MKNRTRKSGRNNVALKKVLPLTVAISLITSGNIMAAPKYIDVDLGNGKTARFDAMLMGRSKAYREQAVEALEKALTDSGRKIVINDTDIEQWVDFSDATSNLKNYEDLVSAISSGTETDYAIKPEDVPPVDVEVIINDSGTVVEAKVDAAQLRKALQEANEILAGDTSIYNSELVADLEALVEDVEDMLAHLDKYSQDNLDDKANELDALVVEVLESEPDLPYEQ